jgi:hypothetical protein
MFDLFRKLVDKFQLGGGDDLDLFPELRKHSVPVLQPSANAAPDWASAEFPKRLMEVTAEIKTRQTEATRLRSIVGILWETGDALEQGVCDLFNDLGFVATRTTKGTTYDITVELGDNKRLLVEVGGIDGPLRKDSNKIAQVLQVEQNKASDTDRVVIALNAHRLQPLADRAKLGAVTPDALSLLSKLSATIILTPRLHEIWKRSPTARDAARKHRDQVYAHSGGIFA